MGYRKILADIVSANGQAAAIGAKLGKDFGPHEKESLLALIIEDLMVLGPDKLDEAAIQDHIPMLEAMGRLSHRDEVSISLDIYRALLEYSERIVHSPWAYTSEGVFLSWASLHLQLVGGVIARY